MLATNIPGMAYFGSAQLRDVNLPDIFQPGARMQHAHRLGLSALADAVVDDGHTRPQRVHQRSEFELCWPWRDTSRNSTVPRRLSGHISSNSLFHGKSARYSARNFPKVTCEPTECSSSVLPSGPPDTGFTVCGVNPRNADSGGPRPAAAS